MTPPQMFIIAGPPGAGKSTGFGLLSYAERVFNADDRAAQLNGASYLAIPAAIRRQVNLEFESFVRANITTGQSFALETTLRSRVTFEQARMAKDAGFTVSMIYIGLDGFERHLARVTQRALLGGHAASETTLRRIYESSIANLRLAMNPDESGIDSVRVFDNSVLGRMAELVVETDRGRIDYLANNLPAWLQTALHWSDSDVSKIRQDIARR